VAISTKASVLSANAGLSALKGIHRSTQQCTRK